jgi:Ti-type conjugative transfer relaxase TraA
VALFHMTAQVIGRSAGRSAVAAAAYRAGARLRDDRLGREHDFTGKAGVVHSAVLLPAAAPDELADRATLWNAVEAGERRKDAQLAREIEFALPEELSDAENIELARAYVQERFVERGMVADLNVHKNSGPGGEARPHAHIMLTMRAVGPGGFGRKERAWNDALDYVDARAALAVAINQRLAARGLAARVDHRSYAQRGIALEPQTKVGAAARRAGLEGVASSRAEDHRAIARRNGARIAARPAVALDLLTEHHSTFTRRDLARLAATHSDGAEQFRLVMARVEASPELVRLGADGRGEERLTTRAMLAVERRMEADAAGLAASRAHGIGGRDPVAALAALLPGRDPGAAAGLTAEQRDALRHVTRPDGLALVVGYAGTGKSAMLGAAREMWERAGYKVRGAALSGIAAEGLRGGSGIESRTLASLDHAWSRGRDGLASRDVLVVDEAGMVGSRQLGGVLARARAAGAKVVLVGDPEQLQAIRAGGAFRALEARHGAARLGQVRRQREAWQRAATVELATDRTPEALARYEAAGMVHAAATRADARARLVEMWDHDRREAPERSRVILAHTREDVRALNALARARLREAGALGAEREVAAEPGARALAAGDRLMFLRNERGLGVRNGTLGTVERVEGRGRGAKLAVRLDDAGDAGRRSLTFAVRDYPHVDHGYAATVHKAQGVTVDRSYVLATPQMDRHTAYVALTRHRVGTELAYARADFRDPDRLSAALSRERRKDTTLDYVASPPRRKPTMPDRATAPPSAAQPPARPVAASPALFGRPAEEANRLAAIRDQARRDATDRALPRLTGTDRVSSEGRHGGAAPAEAGRLAAVREQARRDAAERAARAAALPAWDEERARQYAEGARRSHASRSARADRERAAERGRERGRGLDPGR